VISDWSDFASAAEGPAVAAVADDFEEFVPPPAAALPTDVAFQFVPSITLTTVRIVHCTGQVN